MERNENKLEFTNIEKSRIIKHRDSFQLKIHSIFFEKGFEYKSGLVLEFRDEKNKLLNTISFTSLNHNNDNILNASNVKLIDFDGSNIKVELSENSNLKN